MKNTMDWQFRILASWVQWEEEEQGSVCPKTESDLGSSDARLQHVCWSWEEGGWLKSGTQKSLHGPLLSALLIPQNRTHVYPQGRKLGIQGVAKAIYGSRGQARLTLGVCLSVTLSPTPMNARECTHTHTHSPLWLLSERRTYTGQVPGFCCAMAQVQELRWSLK